MILDCPLRKELVYTVATPTFHHWRLEDRKCGLSFQSPADGRAFDRGVRKAMEDLAEGDAAPPHPTPHPPHYNQLKYYQAGVGKLQPVKAL